MGGYGKWRLTDDDYKEIATREIAEDPYTDSWSKDFSKENIEREAQRLKAQDKWL